MMKLLMLVALATVTLAVRRFEGDQVLSIYPSTPAHLDVLKQLEAIHGVVDFWKPDSAELATIGQKVDVHISSEYVKAARTILRNAELSFSTKIADLQHTIDQQFDMAQSRDLTGFDYTVYHTYEEIKQWSADIAAAYPTLARNEVMGQTYEGRDVNMLTLGASPSNPIVLIDCGIHAREWISPAVCQCYVNRMLSEYATNPTVKLMMDSLTIKVIPLLNADGYAYSWSDDRMWRKTRSNYGTVCTGTDPNRNFDANWSGPGSSSSPCSETYYGPSVASEPLTKLLQNFVIANKGNIKMYITLHSYGQVFIYPYSYAVKNVDNKDEHDNLAAASAAAIEAVHGKAHTYGPGYQSMYLAAGGSDDFSKDNGATLAYTIELRDEGRFGFILPESQIADSCTEMYAGFDVLLKHVADNYA